MNETAAGISGEPAKRLTESWTDRLGQSSRFMAVVTGIVFVLLYPFLSFPWFADALTIASFTVAVVALALSNRARRLRRAAVVADAFWYSGAFRYLLSILMGSLVLPESVPFQPLIPGVVRSLSGTSAAWLGVVAGLLLIPSVLVWWVRAMDRRVERLARTLVASRGIAAPEEREVLRGYCDVAEKLADEAIFAAMLAGMCVLFCGVFPWSGFMTMLQVPAVLLIPNLAYILLVQFIPAALIGVAVERAAR